MANSEQDHINQIRRDKYWLNENGRLKGVNPLASDLHNSIQALAQDLNNKDTHFILELIQNAEDNDYQVAEPSLSLKLLITDPTNTNGTSGALIFQNNEVGFLAENVNAICAVGHTTKSKVQGYIGEKGIGFKSVFRVTSIPHILSKGYRFCLPKEDQETGLGFIVPKWIDIPPNGTDLNQTTIILPL
ncbi:MAG: sacsin N-terminal ATP-binding-like domain-containing protein, partial [Candidatus Methylumidiphilus sp.]